MDLDGLRATWNELGSRDALWAVLTGPREGRREWDREAFFATGVDEIRAVHARLADLGVAAGRERALDFGCGAGRLTQALAGVYAEVHGVDIARSMLDAAAQYDTTGRCQFHLNERGDLALFPDAHFDFVYTNIVLQHMEPRFSRAYIAEFFRVLRPGGVAVFQIPAAPVPRVPARTRMDGALPLSDRRAEIGAPAAAVRCAPGARLVLPVRVTNRGTRHWAVDGQDDGRFAIHLANHWRSRWGFTVRWDDARAVLHADLPPGETAEVVLACDAPAKPGRYRLELDMVQEGVAWFAAGGSTVARMAVVVDAALPSGAVEGLPRRMEMHGVARTEVEALVEASGGAVVAADADDAPGPDWTSFRYITVKR